MNTRHEANSSWTQKGNHFLITKEATLSTSRKPDSGKVYYALESRGVDHTMH